MQASDLIINLDAAGRRSLLGRILKPYNFLQHAHNDPRATDGTDMDPRHVIGHALSALKMVSSASPLPNTIKPYLKRCDLLAAEQASETQS